MKKSISKKLKKYLLKNGYENIFNDLQNSESGNNYFDFSYTDRSKISYLKGDRIPLKSHLLYCKEYRKNKAFHTKIGKLLSDKIDNTTIQGISTLMYNRALKNDVKIFETKDICKYYLESNYAENTGSLGNSCMRYNHCQDWVKFYENNDNVKLLVCTNSSDKVLARALLWDNVKIDNIPNNKYLDRVYAINDNIQELLYSYANSKKIIHFKNKDYKKLKICTIIDDDIPLPYFDTFQHYSYNNLNNYSGEYSLTSTNGDCLQNNLCECSECGSEFDQENEGCTSYNGEHLCDNCGIYIESEDGFFAVSDCICVNDTWYHKNDENLIEINNTWYTKDDENICYSESDNEYYLLDDCVYSEYHNSYLLSEDCVFVENKDDYMFSSDDDVIEIDTKYYIKDDDTIVKINDVYYLKENCIEIENNFYLEDDENIYFDHELQTWNLRQYSFLK